MSQRDSSPKHILRQAMRLALLGAATTLAPVAINTAIAAGSETAATAFYTFKAGDLGSTLSHAAAQSRIALAFDPSLTQGKRNPAVQGEYTPIGLMNALLAGSDLVITPSTGGSYTLNKASDVTLLGVSVVGDAFQKSSALYAAGHVETNSRLGALGNQDAINVPFNVVSYTAQVVEDQQLESIADVLANDAGVQTGFGYGNFSEKFMIRGFELDSDAISYGGLYGILPRQMVSTNPVGSVQVLKGASAFLNGVTPGGSGVGGAINIEPKRAYEDYTRFTLDTTAEARTGLSTDVARRFGEDDQFGTHISLLHRDRDTAIDHESREETSFNAGFDLQAEQFSASVDVGYQKQDIEGGRSVVYQGSITEIPSAPKSDTNYAPDWTTSELETAYGMINAEYRINEQWRVHGAIGMNRNKEFGIYSSPTLSNNEGDATTGRMSVPFESETFSSALGLEGDVMTGSVSHEIHVGYSGFVNKTHSAYTMAWPGVATNIYDPADVDYLGDDTFAGGNMGNPNIRSKTDASGFSLSDTLGFMDDRLLLTLGTRYQNINVKDYSYDGVLDTEYDESATSPLYGVLYRLTPDVSVYANHVESLQQGDTAPNSADNSGQVFKPFHAKQNELGIKWEGQRFAANAAVFEIQQPSGYLKDNVYGIYGDQVNRGLEVSAYGNITRNLRVNSSAAWTDAELKNTEGGSNDGNTAVGVAKYRFVLGAEYDLPIDQPITVGGKVIHTGPQYLDAANTLKLDDWTRVDLTARYESEIGEYPVTWRLNITNLTNEDYWASAAGGYLTQGEPREIKLSLTTEF